MKKDLQQQAVHMKQNRKYKKGWQVFVRMLALCVVFCTTYVLVLPAITMQETPICGIEGHVHSQECWSQPKAAFQNCGIPDGAVVLHQHTELCRDEAGELICTLAEKTLHTHTESCHTRTETLHCTAAHVHSEACQKTESVLTCTMPETEVVQVCALAEHEHGDGCFMTESLICMVEESEEHSHSESCSSTRTVQICEMEAHTHGEGCFAEEAVGHTHGEDCYTVTEIPCAVSAPTDHVHDSGCYEVLDILTCGLEEITESTAV